MEWSFRSSRERYLKYLVFFQCLVVFYSLYFVVCFLFINLRSINYIQPMLSLLSLNIIKHTHLPSSPSSSPSPPLLSSNYNNNSSSSSSTNHTKPRQTYQILSRGILKMWDIIFTSSIGLKYIFVTSKYFHLGRVDDTETLSLSPPSPTTPSSS